MGEVYLDGERVDFQGAPPQSIAEVWTLIEQHLEGAGRVLESARVDGRECDAEQAMEISSYERLEFASLAFTRKLLLVGEGWSKDCSEKVDAIEKLSVQALALRWDEVLSKSIALLESMRPIIEGLGLIDEVGKQSGAEWAEGFSGELAKAAATVERVIQAIEAKSCVKVSDRLALEMRPCWSSVAECLDRRVLPALRKEDAGG